MIAGAFFLSAALGLAGLPPVAPLPVAVDDAPSRYVCPPCPHVDDLLHARQHDAPGTCPVCGMALVEYPVPLNASNPRLRTGSGAFSMAVGPEGQREVSVYYYRPGTLREDSPVLMVMPGAGRNAWDYRDHWIEAAERAGVLVLSPHYPESRYPRFWNYNLAGMIDDVEIDRDAGRLAGYRIVTDRQRWLFDDIDRIFDQAVRAAGLKTSRYDLFGHSAGGQFLHRFALFAAEGTRADRILAANAGWYTVPTTEARFPYGLSGAPILPAQLESAFSRRLVVFLGGSDDANETRGDLVRNGDTDRQGTHRLARGRYFHARAAETAERLGVGFNWSLVVVPGVGHDPEGMSRAAAEYLYGPPAGAAGVGIPVGEADRKD